MIQLRSDEKIAKAFEVTKSAHGSGVFYITDLGTYFESCRYGTVVEAGFDMLRSYNAVKGNVFQIVWDAQNNERFSYEIKVDSAEEVMAVCKDANAEYARSMTETQALRSERAVEYRTAQNTQLSSR